MADDIQRKWDERYRDPDREWPQALRVLCENVHLLPGRGVALDLACGLGANACLLARHGLETHAWDFSLVAIEKLSARARSLGLSVVTQVRDVMQMPPEPGSFDVVVVGHFLERTLAPAIIAALRSDGLLFYQTFIRSPVSDYGPRNLDYRLADNELLALFAPLRIVVYREEGLIGDLQRGFRDEAMLVAQRTP